MEELLPFLPKLAEYGAVGVIAGVLYLIARLYLPHFATLSSALQALPPALQALVERIKEVEQGLDQVRSELAVIKDRLPRSTPPADGRDGLLIELLERRRQRVGD